MKMKLCMISNSGERKHNQNLQYISYDGDHLLMILT